MAKIYVGSARSDENRKANGQAGDSRQTSSTNDMTGEVSIQEMYTHSKGWVIIRLKDEKQAEKAAERMKTACNNICIGYSQADRYGVHKYGIDTKTPTNCDCSSLGRQVFKEATGKDPGNFTTLNAVSILKATGLVDIIDYVSQEKTPVYDGDFLVTKTKGHMEVVVSGNPRSAQQKDVTKEVVGTAVAKQTMKIRSASNTLSKVVGYVSAGSTVEVLEVLSNGWYKIVCSKESCGYAYVSNAGNKYFTYTEKKTNSSTASKQKYISNGIDYALVFEPTYYSNKYADLKKAFGTNADKLFNHFLTYGMKEGRQACETFNVNVYKKTYVDLQKAFGNNLPEYYKHYIRYGHKEGRKTV